MGKLGGREITASSDLDLIVVYDFDPEVKSSDGPKPLPVSQYYARLTQRLISSISAPTAEGRLFEVDMRLRPSGNQGPVATQLSSFVDYQEHHAWTWEQMALTRARVVSGPEGLRQRIELAIAAALVRPRDALQVAAEVRDMRERIWAQKGTEQLWQLKQTRGGQVDLEFIAQCLQLVHAHDHPSVLSQNTLGAFQGLRDAGVLSEAAAVELCRAGELLNTLTQLIRLCFEGTFLPADAPDGLKSLLAASCGEPDFSRLEARLGETLATVGRLYDELIPSGE